MSDLLWSRVALSPEFFEFYFQSVFTGVYTATGEQWRNGMAQAHFPMWMMSGGYKVAIGGIEFNLHYQFT